MTDNRNEIVGLSLNPKRNSSSTKFSFDENGKNITHAII